MPPRTSRYELRRQFIGICAPANFRTIINEIDGGCAQQKRAYVRGVFLRLRPADEAACCTATVTPWAFKWTLTANLS